MLDLHIFHGESSPHSLAVERRAWVRFSCDLEASCVPSDDDPEILWPARVVNVSCGGVGLLLSRRFEPGTLLQVEVQIPKLGFFRPLLVQVLHLTGQEFGGWLVGCSFTQPLEENDVKQLR